MDIPQAQMIQDQGQAILDLIGTRNIFSILITTFMVRIYRAAKYREIEDIKRTVLMYAVGIGAGTIILTSDITTIATWGADNYVVFIQEIGAGMFLTYFGSILFYELLRWAIKFLIEFRHGKTGEKTLIAFYWFLSPAPAAIKKKVNGVKQSIEIEPDENLTRMNATVFKGATPQDKTVFLDPDKRAGENYAETDKD